MPDLIDIILSAPGYVEKGRKLIGRFRPDFEKKLRRKVRRLGNEQIRVSCGQLIRLEVDGHILLVKGGRLEFQLQPPGGVTKTYPSGWREVEELGALAEDHFEIRQEDKYDLRIRISAARFGEFLDWYKKGDGREPTPGREFGEEFLETSILPEYLFGNVQFERERTYASELRDAPHFGCKEVLVHEVFRPILTVEQEDALRELLKSNPLADDSSFAWVPFSQVRSLGAVSGASSQGLAIAEHSLWMLDPNTVEALR